MRRFIIILLLSLLTTIVAQAQIIIGGNVYGGGNKGELIGSTNVVINDVILLGDRDFNSSLPGAVAAGDVKEAAVPAVYYTQGEIDAAAEGDDAYGKTTSDIKVPSKDAVLYTINSAAVHNAQLYLARGGGVFGGARMARVGGSSTVTINGGYVLNVYGANDISGTVAGGTNINIFSTVIGDVYGGGNGSYIYWNKPFDSFEDQRYIDAKNTISSELIARNYSQEQIDYVENLQKDTHYTVAEGQTSLDALNAMRPTAPSTNILLQGTATKQVYVNGGVYCGGNSATLGVGTQAVNPKATLTLGRYVAPRNVFMGCNGANLVTAQSIFYLSNDAVSDIDLTTSANMEQYMSAVAMGIPVELKFTDDYPTTIGEAESILDMAHIGNFFCGGNVGSMTADGVHDFQFSKIVFIHEKIVGGCNSAKVNASALNAEYVGGILGTTGTAGGTSDVKVWLNLSGILLEPRVLNFDVDAREFDFDWYMSDGDGDPETDDGALKWGNVYGGCFSSGQIAGGVKIDINAPTVKYEDIFGPKTENNSYGMPLAGISEFDQSQDVFCKAFSVFGGGYGSAAVVNGNVTINITGNGTAFQVFGGGEKGPIYGNVEVNLNGGRVNELYGGGFAGDVFGHTTVNLNSGWFFDAFGGACNADVRDYTEVFIGRTGGSLRGYNVYGGNDFGGKVGLTAADGYTPITHKGYNNADIASNTFVQYWHGQVDSIAGGNYGDYDYEVKYSEIAANLIAQGDKPAGFNYAKPSIDKSFVKVSTDEQHNEDKVKYFLGGSEGASGEATNDKMQHYTYVLIDAPGLNMPGANVYGGGAHAGLCGGTTEVYLMHGTLRNVFGASLNEGGTEHAHVYVPSGSTIHVNAIFGGADGSIVKEPEESDEDYEERVAEFNANINKIPCDAKYAIVDFNSSTATVEEAIYGGNNFQRRTVFSTINISAPVRNLAGKLRDIFGAGLGQNSWGCCTKVNLNEGALVANVYGGGSNGRVFESLSEWERLMVVYRNNPARYNNGPVPSAFYDDIPIIHQSLDDDKQDDKFADPLYYTEEDADGIWHYLDNMPHVETQTGDVRVENPRFEEYINRLLTNSKYSTWFSNKGWTVESVREEYNRRWSWTPGDHNTNVFINNGAVVTGNAFAGGKGSSASVSGRTCLTLNGGTVRGNIYGGGEEGFVADRYLLGMDKVNVTIDGGFSYEDPERGGATITMVDESINDTIASARVFIKGGSVRYVYGGGLAGHIGCRVLGWDDRTLQTYPAPANYGLVMAATYVSVGKRDKNVDPSHPLSFIDGLPTVTRSIFGGGERGRVFGTTDLTINNGYIGYKHITADEFSALSSTKSLAEIVALDDDEREELIAAGSIPSGYPEGTTGYFLENTVGDDGAILSENGNAFGAGYGEGALTIHTNVNMYGGVVRNSLYGGGEIAAVGHGETREVPGSSLRTLNAIYCPGSTRIEMFNGHVRRDVFGGGRGYSFDRTGNEITGSELYTDGYVFGHTIAHVHGGEVGTLAGLEQGYGNVFGGGNVGYVYSGFGTADRTKDTGSPGNYYYYSNQLTRVCQEEYHSFGGIDYRVGETISEWAYTLLPEGEHRYWVQHPVHELTEDCAVLIAPYPQVLPTWKDFTDGNTEKDVTTVTINGNTYRPYEYVTIDDINTLKAKDDISSVGALSPGDAGYNSALLETDRATWLKLDDKGITIHNAIFAGGNVSKGSDKIFANATTVYGNVTASVRDAFSRDLISIGTEHVGGLYGGGNLSLVNGYREIHIENYGTDYYNLESEISLEDYRTKLTDREKEYFRLRFKAKSAIEDVTINGVTFPDIPAGKMLWEDEYNDLPAAQQNTPGTEDKWEIDGVCNLHAGRLLNTIQRADLVGMYGSRLVLQGAQDRVTDVIDFTRYTINRVGELSLNKKVAPYAPLDDDKKHGNYFGIYSVVHYLGNLTSDVRFEDARPSDEIKEGEPSSYYGYKYAYRDKRKRNHGTCHNKVALASGVFLELTTEHSTADEKDYGYITGIVELDLINAKADNVGGGYVYARNEHRVRQYYPNRHNVTLSPYNSDARTFKRYIYDPSDPQLAEMTSDEKTGVVGPSAGYTWGQYLEIQTSGNFIHDANKKIIIDDCYPNNAEYFPTSSNYSPAHYWYVKGEVYVYDQYISAYTGTSTAYQVEERIPLTITAGSHGMLTLLNVQPNLYAYNNAVGDLIGESGQPVNNGAQTYYLNNVIDYWSYNQLNATEQAYFVQETLRAVKPFNTDGSSTASNDTIKTAVDYVSFKAGLSSHTNNDGVTITKALYSVNEGDWVDADEIFHSSNNMGHNTGYVLTFRMDSPFDWNTWYTPKTGSDTDISTTAWTALPETGAGALDSRDDYIAGPTFSPAASTAYGQRHYDRGELIPEEVYVNYPYTPAQATAQGNQATVTKCYVIADDEPITYTGGTINLGSPISETRYYELTGYDTSSSTYTDSPIDHTKFEQALLCTNTIQLSEDRYIFNGEVVSTTQKSAMMEIFKTTYKNKQLEQYMLDHRLDPTIASEVTTAKTAVGYDGGALASEANDEAERVFNSCLSLAYYCEVAGLYGGRAYDAATNYNPLESWCVLDATDRGHFTFNEDAFDLIRFDNYNSAANDKYGRNDGTYPYFPTDMSYYGDPYYQGRPVEYTAVYKGDTPLSLGASVNKRSYEVVSPSLPSGTPLSGYYTKSGDVYVPCDATATADGTTTYYKIGNPTPSTTLNKGDMLDREEYEAHIPNEQYYFAPVTVNKSSEAQDYYIVNTAFVQGDIPYVVGQTISASAYVSLAEDKRAKVDIVRIDYRNYDDGTHPEYVTLFYCTNGFTRGAGVADIESVNVADGTVGTTYAAGSTVPQKTFITKTEYSKLPNDQKNFLIKGLEPMETSTLYVSRESEIEDLGSERIYTVIYQYTYNESDDADNVELANELHIFNIHIKFESGVPAIGEVLPPATVLPGSTVGLKQPSVTQGAYEIMGGGWEIFSNHEDALSHHNGEAFYNNNTKVYWYQNQYERDGSHYGCWVAYYAMTRAGKTYSKPVPLSVANYHDIAEVMADKEHHLYIDHPYVERDSKIYINDYTSTNQNGLDLLKDLYELSLVTASGGGYTVADGKITAATGDANANLVDHDLLSSYVEANENLDFILRTDIDHSGTPWISLGGSSATCWEGDFHGDGHTISGLDHSLFNHLCGNVYNLGVTGSFTGAGIAETGSGYVENCWIKTSAPNSSDDPLVPALQKGTGHYAVFGNPTSEGNIIQVVNCYYPSSNEYTVPASDSHGVAIPMTDREFYNGTVAYNLNGFYLYKRYSDNNTNSGLGYTYWKPGETEPQTGYYASNPSFCSSGYNGFKYVEDRYSNVDFIYADGVIPTQDDIRLYKDNNKYSPRWPDDYLFFGQLLTYGYHEGRPHESQPTIIYKVEMDDGLHAPYMYMPENDWANRVYRCPAYYGSKDMGVFHYNPWCDLAGYSSNGTKEAYPGMTAVDFSGYNDVFKNNSGTAASLSYRIGWQTINNATGNTYAGLGLETHGAFYPPLLDDGGLIGIRNRDLTHNLLAYAPYDDGTEAIHKTWDVVVNTTTDPVFSEKFSTDTADPNHIYNTVDAVNTGSIRAHSVERAGANAVNYISYRDHLLVDLYDFNCPIEYSFYAGEGSTPGTRMWYQRKPSQYAGQWTNAISTVIIDSKAGWEGISLPFTVDLVTTHQKGELTHFYEGSTTGHEYWLREYRNIAAMEGTPTPAEKLEALFTYPNKQNGNNIEYTNTFLWDYYYNETTTPHHEDANNDQYQTYYSSSHTFDDYPQQQRAVPYLVGFPGERYYEFDLSGKFEAITTADPDPSKLEQQVITFVSEAGVTIHVSDDELVGIDHNGFTFMPSYMKKTLESVSVDDTSTPRSYALSVDGRAYNAVTRAADAAVGTGNVTVQPFRPYFTANVASSPAKQFNQVRSIVFSQELSQLQGQELPDDIDETGELTISTKKGKIIVSSTLAKERNVRIVTVSGITIDNYTIQPGETIETPINNAGVYIVNRTKVFVR